MTVEGRKRPNPPGTGRQFGRLMETSAWRPTSTCDPFFGALDLAAVRGAPDSSAGFRMSLPRTNEQFRSAANPTQALSWPSEEDGGRAEHAHSAQGTETLAVVTAAPQCGSDVGTAKRDPAESPMRNKNENRSLVGRWQADSCATQLHRL